MPPFWLRALAAIAPTATLRRVEAYHALRDYDGAKVNRRTTGLTGRNTSANTEIAAGLSKLRDRSRDLVRNTSTAARALDVLVALIVSHGVQPKWNTGSKTTDRKCKELWTAWAARCDAAGEQDFNGILATAVRAMLEGGDALVRMLPSRLDGSGVVPLRLQVLEGDHLDDSRVTLLRKAGPRIKMCIELGDWDERLAYHLTSEHPGEFDAVYERKTIRVARADICHLYRPLRAGQLRGVPIFAPVLLSSRDHSDLVDALVTKARMEAVHGLIVTPPAGVASSLVQGGREESGKTVIAYAPGMVASMPAGHEVKTLEPTGSGAFPEVNVQILQAIASGVGVTYDQLTGDLRRANYSSMKAGDRVQRVLVQQIQWLTLVPMLLDRVAARFTEMAVMAGLLRDRKGGYPVTWIMPAIEPIDQQRDLDADVAAVRAGRMSPQEFIGAWGRDWLEVLDEIAAFNKEADARGLVLQTDPRKTSGAGLTQARPAGTVLPSTDVAETDPNAPADAAADLMSGA